MSKIIQLKHYLPEIENLAPVAVAPDDRATAMTAMQELQDAIRESIEYGYDAKTVARFVLGIVDETRHKLGGNRLTPDEFNKLLGGGNERF